MATANGFLRARKKSRLHPVRRKFEIFPQAIFIGVSEDPNDRGFGGIRTRRTEENHEQSRRKDEDSRQLFHIEILRAIRQKRKGDQAEGSEQDRKTDVDDPVVHRPEVGPKCPTYSASSGPGYKRVAGCETGGPEEIPQKRNIYTLTRLPPPR